MFNDIGEPSVGHGAPVLRTAYSPKRSAPKSSKLLARRGCIILDRRQSPPQNEEIPFCPRFEYRPTRGLPRPQVVRERPKPRVRRTGGLELGRCERQHQRLVRVHHLACGEAKLLPYRCLARSAGVPPDCVRRRPLVRKQNGYWWVRDHAERGATQDKFSHARMAICAHNQKVRLIRSEIGA